MIEDLWYKNALIYCIDVKTFQDSNGDGIGDFRGLMRRLDYLAGLGVTCVWLLPFQRSPGRDNGYDISDYYSVDERVGSLGDFVQFTHEAKQYGIRVIADLVVNHTSNRHPWFLDARGSTRSKFRDWYVWSDKRPRDFRTGMVFPGVQKETWTWDPKARAYYFHRFYDFQPDLNSSNPEVWAEIRRIMGFWMQLGVSGFRMDAVPFVISRKGERARHIEMYRQLHELRNFVQWRSGDGVLLGEANVVPSNDADYFGDGDRLHLIFNFWVNQNLFLALATGDARPLARALEQTRLSGPAQTPQWANFLRNNDELDLGRLKPKDRARLFREFGPEPSMQIYGRGIRRRLAPMMNGDRRRQELAYSLMFTLPGTPVLRFGDEIGLGEDLHLKERASCRTPMQWADEKNGAFSSARRTILPVIASGLFGHHAGVNVAVQRRNPDSLLNWMERLIRMRKECPEIGRGEWRILETDARSVLALRYDWRGNAVVIMHNLDAKPQRAAFGAGGDAHLLVNLLSEEHARSDGRGRHSIQLDGYGYRWFRVGTMNHAERKPS